MVTITAPLSTPHRDETARVALERVAREPVPPLMVSIGERCGDALIEAFARIAAAYYRAK